MKSVNTNKRVLFWFRRDLRLHDNRALFEACQDSEKVILVYCFDKSHLSALDSKDRRIIFIFDSLTELFKKISHLNSYLIILVGEPFKEIPKLAKKFNVHSVYSNRDYEPDSRQLFKIIRNKLQKDNIDFKTYKDEVIFDTDDILTKLHLPYKVFTPYKKAWLNKLNSDFNFIKEYSPNLKKLIPKKSISNVYKKTISLKSIGFKRVNLDVKPGQKEASLQFKNFLKRIHKYHMHRDYPDLEGTSQLSVHLRYGTISIREIIRVLLTMNSTGSQTWLNELIWREFYKMILYHFPNVTKDTFIDKYNHLKWPGEDLHFNAWTEGQTGYPIIDAAMRYFKKTGWMHNRLRMIVASFLVKDLLIDWRKGEEYFAQNLLDYDLSANNGGWQWCASTGTDAQPYFRIFNPIEQSKKFDPNAYFIKEHCPELKKLPARFAIWPSLMNEKAQLKFDFKLGRDYPGPIVSHPLQRKKAMQLYKAC